MSETVIDDGVVQTWAQARAARRPPLLVRESLDAYLDGLGVRRDSDGLRVTPIGGGHSNAMFRLQRGGHTLVLRRPPRPPLPPGAHDVVREARLLQGLAATDVPVPEVVAVCTDDSVAGAPFFLMELVEGELLEDRLPADGSLQDPGARAAVADAFIDALVALHAVEPERAGLSWLGKPTGYLERQLRRFAGSWEVNRTRDLPQMEQLHAWLAAHRPQSGPATIVHGDFRLGNALVRATPPIGIAALLDWEMATIGDPLADLGYLCAAWTDRTDVAVPMFHLSPVTAGAGFRTRAELLDRYAERSGRSLHDLRWYQALAMWKAAVFMEGNVRRATLGMSDDPLLAGFADGVVELADLGLALT